VTTGVSLPGVKDIPRRALTPLLTGPAGRFAAFVIDVGVVGARYYSARLRGREMHW
jgi:hypothetical protein